jgi:DtxR family Mn-dependent transcriptional regulator
VFVRVSDADPEMLRYLAGLGISPGDPFEVLEHQPFGGPLLVRFGAEQHAHEHTLGGALARAMRVDVGVGSPRTHLASSPPRTAIREGVA